ncbi:hypothetical protein C0J52_17853 [Blattella germanica]|nr:hypothetical protein C0J52_17853 [Blattella germanica]
MFTMAVYTKVLIFFVISVACNQIFVEGSLLGCDPTKDQQNITWTDMQVNNESGRITHSDQRSYIKIESLHGKNPIEIHMALREVCEDNVVDRSTVSRWSARFRAGRMRKVAARCVPHHLGDEQKACLQIIAEDLLLRYQTEGEQFLRRILTTDETWIQDFEPELKSQSSQWKFPLREFLTQHIDKSITIGGDILECCKGGPDSDGKSQIHLQRSLSIPKDGSTVTENIGFPLTEKAIAFRDKVPTKECEDAALAAYKESGLDPASISKDRSFE